jgi:CheY-like chemotaxis protein
MTKRLILIVEDDPTLRDLTRRQVNALGFESVVVATGEEAVAHEKEELALIFMDIGLPGIDGGIAASIIREKELLEQCARIPIVALTAHSDRQKAAACGIDDFLQKPALLADIKRVLDKWCVPIGVNG